MSGPITVNALGRTVAVGSTAIITVLFLSSLMANMFISWAPIIGKFCPWWWNERVFLDLKIWNMNRLHTLMGDIWWSS